MARLTDKQKKFADEYLIDLNGTQAAIRSGYSVKSASRIAAELLHKSQVIAYVGERQARLRTKAEITQERVIGELAKIGFADITDYLQYRTAKTVVEHDDDGELVIDYATIIDVRDSSDVDGAPIQEVSVTRDGTFKFKLYDKLTALDKLGRHLGLFDVQAKDTDDSNSGVVVLPEVDDG